MQSPRLMGYLRYPISVQGYPIKIEKTYEIPNNVNSIRTHTHTQTHTQTPGDTISSLLGASHPSELKIIFSYHNPENGVRLKTIVPLTKGHQRSK